MSAYGTKGTFDRAHHSALGFRPRRMPISGKGGCGHGPADVTQGQGVSVAFRDSPAGRALPCTSISRGHCRLIRDLSPESTPR